MAGFDTPQIKIDPYQSTVPVAPVQIPREDLQSQQAPMIYSKAGGIAQVADSMMKGMLKGLQMKEERKFKTAEATMAAQDAGIAAAKKNYDDLLTTEGAGDPKNPNPKTYAAWTAWQKAVNDAAAQRQAFAIPEKQPKKPSSKNRLKTDADPVRSPDDAKGSGAPAAGGFGAGLKQFFERNPHIIPELAIIGMKSQVTPYGQQSPEDVQRKQQYDAAQRQESNQKVVDAATATRNKYAGKKDLTPEQQAEYDNAVSVLTPIAKPSAKTRVVNEIGHPEIQHVIRDDEDIPPGYEVHEKPPAVSQSNLYYDAAAREWGTTRDKLTIPQLEYVDASRARSQAQARGQATYSYRTTDANGNSSTVTRKVSEPIAAPQGVKSLPKEIFRDGQEDSQTGASSSPKAGGTKFNQVPRAPGAGRGRMDAAPTQGGKTQDTWQVSQEKRALEKTLAESKLKALEKYNTATKDGTINTGPAGEAYGREVKIAQDLYDSSMRSLGGASNAPAPSGGPQAQPSPQPQAPAQQAGGKPQQMTPAPQQDATSQQGATHPQPEAGNPPATPPKPRTIEQLRDERNKKKVMGGLYRYSGAEGLADYYGAVGRGISNYVGFNKKVAGAVGHALSTYLNGEPGDVNDYEINGSPVKTTAKDAQEFHDSGFAVREKYNVNGVDHFLTPEEAEQARKAGYKITSSKKHQGPA